jgi:hypothetical protein
MIDDSTTTTGHVAAAQAGVTVTAEAPAKAARKKTTAAVGPRRQAIAPAVETPPAGKTQKIAKRTAKSVPSA